MKRETARKISLFYGLTALLSLAAFAFVVLHGLGFRVNRSESLPGIVYRTVPLRDGEEVHRGDCVLIDLSKVSNPVIAEGVRRGYVSELLNQPMMKKIGAVPGDTVELHEGFLVVNGEATAITVASQDSRNQPLTAFPTPLTLSEGDYWLSSDPERGFDSRYFGPLRREAFTHRALPVFP
jgi:conjugal transfer pilin signal peptidase TrbI